MTTLRALRLWSAVLPIALGALTACAESVPFDPVALSQSTDEIINVMDNSPAMQSMDVLGSKMTAGAPAMGAPALVAATIPGLSAPTAGFPAWAARRLRALQSAESVAAPEAVIIPTLVLGTVWEYDPATTRYKLKSATGGPSNGVRFLLYAVNPLTRTVTLPLQETGYADLLDESTSPTALQLRLKAYDNAKAKVLIDYTASGSVQATGGTVTSATVNVSGYISDGTTQVDFTLTQQLSTTSGISVNYTFRVPEKDVEIKFEATFTLTRQATVTLTVKHAGNTTVVAASGTEASISGTIRHNGDLVINISGSPTNPTFTDASGNPLTAEQNAALKKLFDFTDQLLDHVDEMLAPAHLLLGIAAFFA